MADASKILTREQVIDHTNPLAFGSAESCAALRMHDAALRALVAELASALEYMSAVAASLAEPVDHCPGCGSGPGLRHHVECRVTIVRPLLARAKACGET
jgi:hypothetical protein